MGVDRNLVQNVAASGTHSTLFRALQAAELIDMLFSPGPFTLFAPTDAAFAKLPPGLLEQLLAAANRVRLTDLLTFHLVSGHLPVAELAARAKAARNHATLRTLAGLPLSITARGTRIDLIDGHGDMARVTVPDLAQANGLIHVVDAVLLPP